MLIIDEFLQKYFHIQMYKFTFMLINYFNAQINLNTSKLITNFRLIDKAAPLYFTLVYFIYLYDILFLLF